MSGSGTSGPGTSGPRPRKKRIILIAVAALVAIALVAIGGVYAWLALTMSRAGSRPGVAEARQALQEPLPTRTSLFDLDPAAGMDATAQATTDPASSTAPSTGTPPPPETPGTMNLLILGTDKRDDSDETWGRTDTMMLAHVDPVAGFVSLLSFPRDLRVQLGVFGPQKLNAAFALGGDALAIRTIRDLTGLKIDHYAKVDFQAFQALVDHFGGIYVDVDRRYYDEGDVLLPIDLEPGYQRLDGDAALRYVRTRHDQNHDWARIQRQQRFLRAVKEQVVSWDMAFRLPGAVSTLMDYLTTDMGATDALKLAWWAARLDFGRIKQVTLAGNDRMIDGIAYVLSNETQVRDAVNALLTPPEPPSPPSEAHVGDLPLRDTLLDLSGVVVEIIDAGAGQESVAATARFLADHGASVSLGAATKEARTQSAVLFSAQMERSLADKAALVSLATAVPRLVEDAKLRRVVLLAGTDLVPPDPQATLEELEQARWSFLASESGFTLAAPSWVPPRFTFAGSRVYYVASGSGDKLTARITYKKRGEEQYYGLTCTRLTDAPAVTAGRRVTIDGRLFTIVGPARNPERVWWRDGGLVYWVTNTLASALTEEELLGIAASCHTGA